MSMSSHTFLRVGLQRTPTPKSLGPKLSEGVADKWRSAHGWLVQIALATGPDSVAFEMKK